MQRRNGGRELSAALSWLLLVIALTSVAFSQDGVAEHPVNEDFAGEHAEVDPQIVRLRQESFAGWVLRSLGALGPLLLLAGGLSFVFTLVIVIRGNGPFAAAALVLIVPIPLLLGLFGFFQGAIMSFQIIATSLVAPKPHEMAEGISVALFSPLVGLLMTAPSLGVAVLGSLIRAFSKHLPPSSPG